MSTKSFTARHRSILRAIEFGETGHGSGLSAPVAVAVDTIVAAVLRELT